MWVWPLRNEVMYVHMACRRGHHQFTVIQKLELVYKTNGCSARPIILLALYHR